MSEAGGAAIGRVREGARVIGTDGSVGKAIEVLVGDKADERYLGVRTGGLVGRDRHVAAYDVRQAAEDIVSLRISRRDVLTTTARARTRSSRGARSRVRSTGRRRRGRRRRGVAAPLARAPATRSAARCGPASEAEGTEGMSDGP